MYNLIPEDSSIKCRLPMHHISRQTTADNKHYSLEEVAMGHLLIRTPKTNSIKKAIKTLTTLDLPTETLGSVENNQFILNWISPDEVLLLVPKKSEFEIETKLRKSINGHFAIVDVTGAQTILELSGDRAETILKKSCPYDIHPNNFPIGKVVTTVFAKSQAVIRRTGNNSFQLIVRRSFSDYLWKWIVDAGSRP